MPLWSLWTLAVENVVGRIETSDVTPLFSLVSIPSGPDANGALIYATAEENRIEVSRLASPLSPPTTALRRGTVAGGKDGERVPGG